MDSRPFVHLHTHSCYSLLDGAIPVKTLIEATKNLGMDALALTDHGNMFGAAEFYLTAGKAGIKPIVGSEVYVVPGPKADKSNGQKDIRHLILLAKNLEGYRNLVRLSSIGYLEGFYYKPRVDHHDLEEHAAGLIALSACLKGEIPQLILSERYGEAEERACYYRDIFGDGNFYLEIQNHGIAEELKVTPHLVELSRKTGIPLVATNDAHYLLKEHADSHEILLSIATGKTLDQTHDRLKFSSSENYLKSAEQMWELFANIPEALENTAHIAQQCDLSLPMGNVLLPSYPLPSDAGTLDDHLARLARAGAEKIYGAVSQDVKERLDYELDVMKKLGMAGYFLIVQDFIKEAHEKNISVGPGRGSAASSMVCYCLGITRVDPLHHGLTFERFLNPERSSMPDIDLDFCQERRGKIIDYVVEKYGEENVAHIASFGTLRARAAVKDVARVMGLAFDEADSLSKMVPERGDVSLADALQANSELRKRVEENPVYGELFRHAQVLEGIARHPSTHPAGVVIAPMPLQDVVPLFKPERDTGTIATTQYDMKSVEKIGLLKGDFLGLRTVTVIDRCLELIQQNQGTVLDLEGVGLDDAETYALLSRAETIGLFQVESGGMTDLLKRIQPDTFRDIVAVNALFRPGPMDWGNVYVECKHGRQKPSYPHPLLEPVLEETYGVLLYQEQVMKTTQVLAGFSAGQADEMRRTMSKKDDESMDLARKQFVSGAVARGVEKRIAEEVYNQIQPFAGYAFNKAHSVAYGLLIYQTAYLKAHYPSEFMTANLSSFVDNPDRLQPLIDECRRLDIEILPPDVNASGVLFSVRENRIRYAFAALKNLGRQAAESIVAAREKDGPFNSIFDFARRVDLRLVTKQALESLAKAGAFDSITPNRAAMMEATSSAIEEGRRFRKSQQEGQLSLFGEDDHAYAVVDPQMPQVPPWTPEERLKRELEAIGFYLSGHPLDRHHWVFSPFGLRTASQAAQMREDESVVVGGQVGRVNRVHKEGSAPFCFLDLEDQQGGKLTVAAFSEVYESGREVMEPGTLVAIKGRLRRRKGELQLIASSMIPLSNAGSWFLSLTVEIDSASDGQMVCHDLDEAFSSFPGSGTAYIEVAMPDGEAIVVQLRNREIEPSEKLAQRLKELPFVMNVEPGLG